MLIKCLPSFRIGGHVVLGAHNLNECVFPCHVREIDNVWIHNDYHLMRAYNNFDVDHDIAIVR